jgi:hypothetical protein
VAPDEAISSPRGRCLRAPVLPQERLGQAAPGPSRRPLGGDPATGGPGQPGPPVNHEETDSARRRPGGACYRPVYLCIIVWCMAIICCIRPMCSSIRLLRAAPERLGSCQILAQRVAQCRPRGVGPHVHPPHVRAHRVHHPRGKGLVGRHPRGHLGGVHRAQGVEVGPHQRHQLHPCTHTSSAVRRTHQNRWMPRNHHEATRIYIPPFLD